MDTDAIFQDGAGCGFTPSGTTSILKKDITVGDIKVQEALCPKTLEKSFEQKNMIAGSSYTDIIFAQEYTDLKIKKIKLALEVAVWQGDTASGSAQLNRFDGLIKLIDAATDEINGNPTGITVATSITVSNIISILEGVNDLIPVEIRRGENGKPTIFLGQEILDLYVKALKAANLYHYKADETPAEDIYLHGTRTLLVSTPGLNGTKRIFGLDPKNLYYATDLMNEEERFELEYAKEAKEVRFDVCWKSGVQVGFTDQVVAFKLV